MKCWPNKHYNFSFLRLLTESVISLIHVFQNLLLVKFFSFSTAVLELYFAELYFAGKGCRYNTTANLFFNPFTDLSLLSVLTFLSSILKIPYLIVDLYITPIWDDAPEWALAIIRKKKKLYTLFTL